MFFSKRNSNKIIPIPICPSLPLKSTCATSCGSPKRSELKHFTKEAIQKMNSILFFQREDSEEKILEDGRMTKYYWAKFVQIEFIIGMIIIITFFFSLQQYEIAQNNDNEQINTILLFLLNISTLMILWVLYLRYQTLLHLNKERRVYSNRDSFFSTGLIYYYIFECIVIAPHPNYYCVDITISLPSLNQDPQFIYKANNLLSLWMNFRLILLIRIYLNCTIFRTSRSFRLCKMYGVEYSYMYTIRCLMKTKPFTTLLTVLCCSTLVFGYILKICESANHSESMNFSYYSNAIWCVLITMTTTGYGDFYAQTPLGRAFSIFIAFFGIFIVSITVVSLTNTLELSKSEIKSMNLLLRLEERKALKLNAAKLVTSISAYRQQKKKTGHNPLIANAYKIRIKKYKNDFSENIRKIKNSLDPISSHEIMNRNFDYMRGELVQVLNNQNQIMENMGIKTKRISLLDAKETDRNLTDRNLTDRFKDELSKKNMDIQEKETLPDEKAGKFPLLLMINSSRKKNALSKKEESMGSQTSTQFSASATQNQEIDHYIQYISEHKKNKISNHLMPTNNNACNSCTLCSGFFKEKVDWRKSFSKDCINLKDKFYWAFYFPSLLKKHHDLNKDQMYMLEVSWAVLLSEDFPVKNNKCFIKNPDISISYEKNFNGNILESKNLSFALEEKDFNNLSQKTEKKLEKSQNAVNIFQMKDNISGIEHNSTILKIDEKALSLNFSTQHDLCDFTCPSKFIRYEENTLVLEKNKKEKLQQQGAYSEAMQNYKRVTNIISKHMKDSKHPLAFLKAEYFHYFQSKYEHLMQIEFRTSTSKTLLANYEFMLNDVRQFVRVFKLCLQNFYKLAEIEKNFKDFGFFSDDNLINFVLNLFFTDEIYFTIFELQRKIDRFNEIIFKRNLKDVKDYPPERFSVPEKYCLNDKTVSFKNNKNKKKPRKTSSTLTSPVIPLCENNTLDTEKGNYCPYQNSIEMLKNMNFLKSPAHKMKLVIKTCENIQEEINEFFEKHEISEKAFLNSEEFLSILVYIISKVKINSMISQCNFMEKFLTQSNLTDKNGYYFYMFKAAVEYVLNNTEGD